MADFVLLELMGVRIRGVVELGKRFIYAADDRILLVDGDLLMPEVFAIAREVLPQAVTAEADAAGPLAPPGH